MTIVIWRLVINVSIKQDERKEQVEINLDERKRKEDFQKLDDEFSLDDILARGKQLKAVHN